MNRFPLNIVGSKRLLATGYGSVGKVVDSIKNTAKVIRAFINHTTFIFKDVGKDRSFRHGVEGMGPKESQLIQEDPEMHEANRDQQESR